MNAVQPSLPSGDTPQPPSDASYVSPLKVLEIVRNRWLTVLLVGIGLSVPLSGVVLTLPSYYDASASLMIGTRQAQFRDLQATQGALDVDAVAINTEVGVIKSQAIASEVAKRLNLAADPYYRAQLDKVPFKVRIMAWLQKLTGHVVKPEPLTPDEERQVVRDLLDKNITILNDGRSYLIMVTARTGRSELSASLANAFVDAYLDFKRHMKISATWRANALLDEQIVPLRVRLRKAEQAVEQYREQNGLIAAEIDHAGSISGQGGSITVADQQLVETNRALIVAESELEEKRARAAQTMSGASSSTEVLSSPLIQQLEAQRADLSARVASLASTAGDANPALMSARAALRHINGQIAQATGQIATSTDKDLKGAESRVAALKATVDRLQQHVAQENDANVTLKQLESEAAAARAVYQDYLARYAQTSTEASLQEPEAELISRAEKPLGVSGPPRSRLLILGLLLSFIIGAAVAVLRDRMQRGIRDTSELDAVPGLYGLGVLPEFSGSLRDIYAPHARLSIYVEAVESIRTLLSFGRNRFRAKTIVVTSAGPEEGKTVLALSLAANTGRAGKKALILDCDTRGPSAADLVRKHVSRKMVTRQKAIVSEINQGELEHDVLPGVDVMTLAGWKSPSDQMIPPSVIKLVMAELSPHYDMVILDTPPLLAFPDAAVLSHETDGIVLVAKWGVTTRDNLKAAMRQLATYDAHVLGGILTQVPVGMAGGVTGVPLDVYRHYGLLAS